MTTEDRLLAICCLVGVVMIVLLFADTIGRCP